VCERRKTANVCYALGTTLLIGLAGDSNRIGSRCMTQSLARYSL